MAVFTAVGAYVATTIFGLAAGSVAAVIVGGIVATGAAMLTSRLINGSAGGASGAGAQAEQGTRVQLQPDPQNKIPVLYGEAYCSGMVTDAWLDNDNKTMTYVLTIAETCNNTSAVYSVLTNSNGPEIYYNDLRLDFDGSNQAKAIRGKKVVNGPGEDHTDDNFAADGGRVFINIYAGDSTRRIWGNTANAYDIQYLADHWDSNRRMEGLIFAVVQINYDSAKGFTGLPQMTFRLKNSIDNPADVLKDYLTSNRYGAGVPLSAVDTTSFNLLETISNEDVSYTPVGGGAAVTQKRYRINGLIDTSRSCMDNIETIILNCGSWLSYDVSLGQWRVIPKRELPGTTWTGPGKTGAVATEPAPAFVFSDDNIVSGINISSTRLDNLYNAADVDFYDRTNKDQRGYVKLDLRLSNPGLLNYNEPGNSLKLTFDLVNNNVQAERLANLELKQSRDDLVITFTTSHYGLQAQAGDVIGVVNELYGWTGTKYPYGKYFRVLKTVERPAGEGVVSEINAIEYNADVYADESITEFTTSANIGIAPRESSGTVLAPSNDGVTVESNPYDPVPNIVVNVLIPTAGGPYDEVQIYVAEETIGSFPALSQYKYLISEFPAPPQDTFTPDTEQSIIITSLPANQAGKQYYIRVRLGIDGIYGEFSDPDLAILPPVTGNYNPSEGSTTAAAGGNLGNIKVGVDPDRNTITTVVGPLVLDSFDNNIAINANMVYFQNNSTAGLRGIVGTVANNDQWFVGGAALGGTSDAGAMVIASGNNGTEPILARQYSGNQSFGPINSTSTIANEVTLLDAGGNSSFPKNVTVGLDLAVNGGDITTTSGQGNLFNTGSTTDINIGNSAITTRIGANSDISTVLIKPQNLVGERNTQNVFNTTAETVNAFGAATAVNIGANTGVTTIAHDLTVNGGNINLNGVATAAQQPFITFQTQPDGVNSQYGLRGYSTVDDPWFIGAGSTGDDEGYLEIATGDNIGGTNNGGQIYVRQYNGAAPLSSVPWFGGNGEIVNELTLLDNIGNTIIPRDTRIGGDLAVNGSATGPNADITTTNLVGTVFDTNATTINAFGAAGTLNMGANFGTATLRNPTLVGTQTTQAVYNTIATTMNAFGEASSLNMGANSGTATLRNPTLVGTQTTQNVYNTVATTLNAFGAASALNMGASSGVATIRNPALVGTQTTQAVYNTIATTINAFGAATAVNIGATAAGTTTIRNAETVVSGNLAVNGGNITSTQSTFNLLNGSTTVNAFTSSTATRIGASSGTTTIGNNLQVTGILNPLTDVTTGQGIRIGSQLIKSATGTTNITLDNTGLVTLMNALKVNGNEIRNNTGAPRIQFTSAGSKLLGNLEVTGVITSPTVSGALTITNGTVSQSISVNADGTLNLGDIVRSQVFSATQNIDTNGYINIGDGVQPSSAEIHRRSSASYFGPSAIIVPPGTNVMTVQDLSYSGANTDPSLTVDLFQSFAAPIGIRSVKLTIVVERGLETQMVEMLVVSNGTSVNSVITSNINTGVNLATFAASFTSGSPAGTIFVRATGTAAGNHYTVDAVKYMYDPNR